MAKEKYGFFDDLLQIKSNPIEFNSIPVDEKKLFVTSSYPQAKNHCAAVSSTNIEEALYGTGDFDDHYRAIGNGPVISFARKNKKVLASKGKFVEYKTKFLRKINFIKNSIDENKIVSLLLMANPLDYHWILCTGYIEYEDGTLVLRIIDNWNKRIRYYRPNKGSIILSATAYKNVK